MSLKYLGRVVHYYKISMVHQKLVRVTTICDLKSPSLKLVTPSLNFSPNADLKSRDSNLVTLMCTLLTKKLSLTLKKTCFFNKLGHFSPLTNGFFVAQSTKNLERVIWAHTRRGKYFLRRVGGYITYRTVL